MTGDTGKGCLEWVKFLIEDLVYPHLRFLFPTAPLRHYTPLGGEVLTFISYLFKKVIIFILIQLSNVWFDRYEISPKVREHGDTLAAIEIEINQLIDEEVKNGIPLNRIIVGQ